MPAARQASNMAREAASSAPPPNCMVPKAKRLAGVPSGDVIAVFMAGTLPRGRDKGNSALRRPLGEVAAAVALHPGGFGLRRLGTGLRPRILPACDCATL